MSKYVEFPLDSGGSILIESPDDPEQPGAGFRRAGLGDAAQAWSNKAHQSFNASVANVRQSAGVLLDSLAELAPDEIEVHFNLKVTGEMGGQLTVAKAGGEANYNVTLRWQKPKKEKEEGGSKKEDAASEKGEASKE